MTFDELHEEKNFLIHMLQEKLHLGELDIDTILRVSERLYYLGMEEGSQPLDIPNKRG